MDFSNFIILLARQRSGTNALRSILETHPDFYCHNEVFSVKHRDSADDPLWREINFFNFLERYAPEDLRRIAPNNHERLFLDFLEYLRCFSAKRYMIIDVKYNTTHFLTESYRWNLAPYLFYLIVKYGLRVFNLTRKNYLRYVVSTLKAERSGRWMTTNAEEPYKDEKVQIDIDYLMRQLDYCDAESRLIHNYFFSYPEYFCYEYQDIFSLSHGVTDHFLETFANQLGITNSFSRETSYRKQSYLPLHETIENYDEVVRTLSGTTFDYCLEDETMYSHVPNDPEVLSLSQERLPVATKPPR